MDIIDCTDTMILGAGFSVAATGGKTPLMKGFFDQATEKEYPALLDALNCLAKQHSIAEVNIEDLLIMLDQVNNCPTKISQLLNADGIQKNYQQIRRELSNYVLNRFRHSTELDLASWAIPLLFHSRRGTTIISMNYDNIAERLLAHREGQRHGKENTDCPHCKMKNLLHRACNCDYGGFILIESDWRGSLLKLHGSISWRRCANRECCSYECLVADEECRPYEPCDCQYCSCQCVAALIMPSLEKKLNEMPEIGIMWEAAKQALIETESLLVCGYSFPKSDELIRHLFSVSLAEKKKLQRVFVIDLYPDEVIGRIKPCIPSECNVDFVTFPVVSGKVPDWFKPMPMETNS